MDLWLEHQITVLEEIPEEKTFTVDNTLKGVNPRTVRGHDRAGHLLLSRPPTPREMAFGMREAPKN